MKRIVCLITVLLLVTAAGALPAAALSVEWEPTDRFFINDFSNVISAEDENAIYAAGVQLFEKTGAQVVAVTVPTTDGDDIDQYGLALGRSWGVGDEDNDTGVVLLLAVEDRQVGISVGYGLEGAITDAKSGILLDNYAIPYFSEDDFSFGMRETYTALVNEVYLEFGLEADPNYTPAEQLEGDSSDVAAFFMFLIFALFLFMTVSGRMPWIFFGGHGHHRGGGFGGGFGNGGGRSGGFRGGGGSFGGGGASRGF